MKVIGAFAIMRTFLKDIVLRSKLPCCVMTAFQLQRFGLERWDLLRFVMLYFKICGMNISQYFKVLRQNFVAVTECIESCW